MGGGALGGHVTFQILSLLSYVVDIVKSSPNPTFLNPMETDKLEAYQNQKLDFFLVFGKLRPQFLMDFHYLKSRMF